MYNTLRPIANTIYLVKFIFNQYLLEVNTLHFFFIFSWGCQTLSCFLSEFPKDCKFFPADTKDDLHKVIVSWPMWDEVVGLCILKHTSKAN